MVKAEDGNRPGSIKDAPAENFAQGVLEVELPEDQFGPRKQGKVRDIWVIGDKRITITTDRTSAFDRLICTIPSKGAILNLTSEWWFEKTQEIIPNHLISVPHPNVLISEQASEVLPVEMVVRAYMAKSATSTSVYHNYVDKGRRNIYGINFPDGLLANQRFPMGPVITPTTKATEGHDLELTEDAARELVDKKGKEGAYSKIKKASERLFILGSAILRQKGLMLVDTKYEFGIDKDGNIMVIDEIHTSDSSRFWRIDTYWEKFEKRENPDTFDKEILRRYLSEKGFKGEGLVPIVSTSVIEDLARAYREPYSLVTGQKLIAKPSSEEEIREAIESAFKISSKGSQQIL